MSKQYDLEALSDTKHSHGSKALEMIMRDVIDGMEDLANLAGYSPQPGGCFEILEIAPEEKVTDAQQAEDKPSAEVVPIGKKSKQAVA